MNSLFFSSLFGVFLILTALLKLSKKTYHIIAILGCIGLAGVNYLEIYNFYLFDYATPFIATSQLSLFFNQIVFILGLIYLILYGSEIQKINQHLPEMYALIFFVLCGIGILSSFNNLLLLFIGIEIVSLPLYILAGLDKKNFYSLEAALKYLLLGAFTTGLILMGIALIYGGTGNFNINNQVELQSKLSFLTAAGLIFIFIGLAFKISAAPFHFWTPDVYDGAPTPFTAFMATIVKIGALFAFIKLFSVQKMNLGDSYSIILIFIIISSFIFGNFTAIFQQSVKRMLAYSSIAQAGFMSMILFFDPSQISESLLLFSVSYCLANLGIFYILSLVTENSFIGFMGLAQRQPLIAFVLSLCLLSLAGIPLTAGFMAKFYILKTLLLSGKYIGLVIIAAIFSIFSLSYYLKLIQFMYFKKEENLLEPSIIKVSPIKKFWLLLIAFFIIFLGITPNSLFNFYYF